MKTMIRKICQNRIILTLLFTFLVINRVITAGGCSFADNLLYNGGFEIGELGEIDPKSSLEGWVLETDNGGSFYLEERVETGKYLKMINAEGNLDNGWYYQEHSFHYNESQTYTLSGMFRLVLSGRTYAQGVYINCDFYNRTNDRIARIMVYAREDFQSYPVYSDAFLANLSPWGENSNSWKDDTEWISFEYDILTCLNNMTDMNEPVERASIEKMRISVMLYTDYTNEAEGYFDEIRFDVTSSKKFFDIRWDLQSLVISFMIVIPIICAKRRKKNPV